MGYNHTASSHKSPFNLLFFISLFILLQSAFPATAQVSTSADHSFGIALNSGYDVPVGNLSYTFKNATTYGISVLSYRDNWTASFSFGYQAYKPKQDTFYYQVDGSNYGTIKYQNFTAYSAYLGIAYNFELSEKLKAYGGINFGAYFTHLVYNSADEFIIDNTDLHEQDLYLAPKLGLNYAISNDLSIGVEGKYNTFMPTGQKSDNSRVGTVYSSYAGNLVLTYKF